MGILPHILCIALNSFLHIKKRTTIILLAVLAVSITVKAARVDSLSIPNYSYLKFLESNNPAGLIRLTDDDYLNNAGKVVFRINRYDAFSNDSVLHQLEEEVLPIINHDSLRLARLVLRVASSPEGPTAFNHQLSIRRAKTLTDFLRKRLIVPVEESVLDIEIIDEDYRLLCAMMRQASDPDYDQVRQLVDRYTSKHDFARLKFELQRFRQGQLWQRLMRIYFPHLRAARLVLVFERPAVKQVLPAVQPALADSIDHATSAVEVKPADVVPTPEFTTVQERDPRREWLSIKTNLLLDFAYVPFGYDRWCPIPNIALEYYPKHGHFTYGASIDFPWWRHYWDFKYFELRNYQLEARYYLRSGDISKNPPGKGKAYRGLYLQAYVHGGLYCFSLNIDRGYVGEYLGGGIGVGYVLPLGKCSRWSLELGAQFGYIYSGYDPFQFEYRGSVDLQDHLYYYDWTLPAAEFKKRQYRYSWFGPTRAGITITYNLLYRRKAKRGISFKSYEWKERRVAR